MATGLPTSSNMTTEHFPNAEEPLQEAEGNHGLQTVQSQLWICTDL